MCKVLSAILILLLSLVACGNRTTTLTDKDSPAGLETGKPEPLSGEEAAGQMATGQQDFLSATEPQGPITMSPVQAATPAASPSTTTSPAASTPAARTPAASTPAASTPSARAPAARAPAARTPATGPSGVQPSRSLAGHDRFLVSRPFDGPRPADFELGLLFDRQGDPSLNPLLASLAQALMKKDLKTAAFNSQALVLAELLYNPDLLSAPEIVRVRFSEARRVPGAAYTLGIRLFSGEGSAQGLAILGSDEKDDWVIEHLDFDLQNLGKQSERTTLLDPYGYSRNLFD